MTRTRATARQAGTAFERLVADHLATTLDDRIDRRVKTGAADKGDISGIRYHGHKIIAECKDYGGRFEVGKWLGEAQREAANDGALCGIVVAKRRGTTDPSEQVVIMTLGDLVALLTA